MNIAYVLADHIHPEGPSGAAAHVRNVVKELRKRGHSVDLITHDVAPNDTGEEESSSSSRDPRSSMKERAVALLPDVLQRALHGYYHRLQNRFLLRRHNALLTASDVIYERDTYQNFGVARYARRNNRPWVIECNGLFWGDESVFRAPWSPSRYRKQHVNKWRQASHIIAVSGPLKQRITNEGVSDAKISVIHNGVDIAPHRRVQTQEVNDLRIRFGLTNHVTIGFLGHVLPKHRIDLLLRAMKTLVPESPVKALIVGGGNVSEYKQMAREAGLEKEIIFTGAIDPKEVPLYVSAMDVCTVPGTSELDSPVKIFDYGAARKPVVAADFSGVKEILTDEVNGVLFSKGSHQELTESLRRLVEKRALRKRLGANLFTSIKQNHTWEQVGKRTEKVLQHVVRDTTL